MASVVLAPCVQAQTAAVDLNRASVTALARVPGLNRSYAERIVANRPYLSKGDLVDRRVIPMGVYVQIKQHVVAMPVAGALERAQAARAKVQRDQAKH